MAPILDSLHRLPVKSKGVFMCCCHQALSQRKWCECWDFLPIIVNLLQNYSLPHNKKYLGVTVVCWHYINKIYLNLKAEVNWSGHLGGEAEELLCHCDNETNAQSSRWGNARKFILFIWEKYFTHPSDVEIITINFLWHTTPHSSVTSQAVLQVNQHLSWRSMSRKDETLLYQLFLLWFCHYYKCNTFVFLVFL